MPCCQSLPGSVVERGLGGGERLAIRRIVADDHELGVGVDGSDDRAAVLANQFLGLAARHAGELAHERDAAAVEQSFLMSR